MELLISLLPYLTVGALTATFVAMDRKIVAAGFRKPYYAVHVAHNVAMVALTASDVWYSFTDLHHALEYPVNWAAIYLCYALHLYHVYEYWRTMHRGDWLHHGLMIGIALPLGSIVPSGTLLGFSLFFTTGLPGGINYAALFAERNGWITHAVEKAINLPIHVWLRCPGCVAHAALTVASILSSPQRTPFYLAVGLTTAALTAWNGIYFMALCFLPTNRPDDALADANNRVRYAQGIPATTGSHE
jgi:hypothetical protein